MSKFSAIVDELGAIKAQQADLANREKELKAKLIAGGQLEYDGDEYRATISTSQRETLDMAAVREKLSDQFIRAHTKVTDVITLRVSARSADANKKAAA